MKDKSINPQRAKIGNRNVKSGYLAKESDPVQRVLSAIQTKRHNYAKEMKHWNIAKAMALNTDNPKRHLLMAIYDDMFEDCFIKGQGRNRILRISNKKFKINVGDTPDEEVKKLLTKKWFYQFLKFTIQAKLYGHSLIRLHPGVDGIEKVSLIPRGNVIPEKGIILQSVSDVDGIDYNDPIYEPYLIPVSGEEDDDLGLFASAVPLWILKKNSWRNWDEFEEIFGIPWRVAKTAATTPTVLAEIDGWLRDMGSAAYGRFPMDTDLEIKESNSRDAYQVFYEKIKAANEEFAILINGQTMTTMNGSSKAQGQVHQDTENEITKDDKTFGASATRDQLIPVLVKYHGYDFKGGEYEWDDTKINVKERLEVIKTIHDLGYRVKKEQLENEFSVSLEEKKEDPPKPDGPGNFKKPTASCCSGLEYRLHKPVIEYKLSKSEEKWLRDLYNDPSPDKWHLETFKKNHNELIGAFTKGFGSIRPDYDLQDHTTVSMMETSIHRFGFDKTVREVIELNNIIKDPEVDSFTKFRTRARKLIGNYNDHWLKTEYDNALAAGQQGDQWIRYMEDAVELPYLKYITAGDDRVRPPHKALDGKVFRKDDLTARKFYPKNGHGCRCDTVELPDDYEGDITTGEGLIAADPDGWEKMQKQGFDFNYGDTKQVFSAGQSYLKDISGHRTIDSMSYKEFELSSFAQIKGKPKYQDKPADDDWFETRKDINNMARLQDYSNKYVWMSESYFSIYKDLSGHLDDVLLNPDEVFWSAAAGNNMRYIKHYSDQAVIVDVSFSAGKPMEVIEIKASKNPDELRSGILVGPNKLKYTDDE